MSDIVISVENLSKQYRLGAIGGRTLRADLSRWWAKRRGQPDPYLRIGQEDLRERYGETIWALRDINLQVRQGEILGIIGRNGAGKSTLLKILSRITAPTSGEVKVKGRIGSLLEVGTGFHPELTGRENVFLNGAILGMTKAEVTRKFDEIVDFAGIEQFIDTPVKRYSSGMYVRLAFAVAAHLEPEILIVDEVLAVGDAEFQKKCLGKMGDIAHGGRTVLFVSHNMGAIHQICDQAMWIDAGKVRFRGSTAETVAEYLDVSREIGGPIVDRVEKLNAAVQLDSIIVNGSPLDDIVLEPNASEIRIEVHGRLQADMRLDIEARIYDYREMPLASFFPGHDRGRTDVINRGEFKITRAFSLPRLLRGDYFLHLSLTDPGLAAWASIPRAVRIRAQGSTTQTGYVFEYRNGGGWILLQDVTDKYIDGDSQTNVQDKTDHA